MDWQQERMAVAELKSRFEHIDRSLLHEEAELKTSQQDLSHTEQAQEIIQHLAQRVQQKAHAQITDIVTSCLKLVFGDNAYQFKIEFERKRGRTEAALKFLRGEQEFEPLESTGGGMVDVAAFALRVSCLLLHRPRLRKLLVLDEPFSAVSAEYQANVCSMLEGLASDLGLQIIMVTHNRSYETGTVYEL